MNKIEEPKQRKVSKRAPVAVKLTRTALLRMQKVNPLMTIENKVLSSSTSRNRQCKFVVPGTTKNGNEKQLKPKEHSACQITPPKPVLRRSLSLTLQPIPTIAYETDVTQSLDNLHELPEPVIFKTPQAYVRRSVSKLTPLTSIKRPFSAANDMQSRLNEWLKNRGRTPDAYRHLKCFGYACNKKKPVLDTLDESNKENIEVVDNKGSFEDLQIAQAPEDLKTVAKNALVDLQKLIQNGYSTQQCEAWLRLIKEKFGDLQHEAQYWECRAAIEEAQGNIGSAVDYYCNAIVQGAEVKAVDESLEQLLQKFSLLNITSDVENQQRMKVIADARNIFKSTIIRYAVQEKKLKNCTNCKTETKFVATPVRRSTRMSRSFHTSTPKVLLCSSLQNLDVTIKENLEFRTNKALN